MITKTEDDTFRRLARPNFFEMNTIFRDWSITHHNKIDRISFMKSYGWTWLEYLTTRRMLTQNGEFRYDDY